MWFVQDHAGSKQWIQDLNSGINIFVPLYYIASEDTEFQPSAYSSKAHITNHWHNSHPTQLSNEE